MAQGKAGLRPRIVRKASGGCCPWCAALAGEYDYPDVPREVYQRHERCRCTVEYDPGYGKRRQNVWTKSWTSQEEDAKIEVRKTYGLERTKIQVPKVENRENTSQIMSPIERGNKGDPSAITHFDVDLNKRQVALLENLPEFGSKKEFPKKEVSMKDLSALTAKTGVEFALFTKGGKRLVVRGNQISTPITVKDAEQMAAEGYRWSGHTHPGTDMNVKAASAGDYAVLHAFKQSQSVIYDSLGRYMTFDND